LDDGAVADECDHVISFSCRDVGVGVGKEMNELWLLNFGDY